MWKLRPHRFQQWQGQQRNRAVGYPYRNSAADLQAGGGDRLPRSLYVLERRMCVAIHQLSGVCRHNAALAPQEKDSAKLARSRFAIWWLTADYTTCSSSAARVMLSASTTETKYLSCLISMAKTITNKATLKAEAATQAWPAVEP
jgi:hypothetical protein